MSFLHFTLPLLFIGFFCIKPPAAAAQSPPASSLPSCSSFFSANASWLSNSSNVTFPIDDSRNLTLSKQASLPLHTNQSSSFTFTSGFTEESALSPPSLAFILVESPQLAASPTSVQSIELRFDILIDFCFAEQIQLTVCSPLSQQMPQILPDGPSNCSLEPQGYDSNQIPFRDNVSLRYDAAAAVVYVQTVEYREGFEFVLTGNLSTEDDMTLYVGYITSGDASINVTSGEASTNVTSGDASTNVTKGLSTLDSASSPSPMGVRDPISTHKDNGKDKHTPKILLWVIIGASLIVLLIVGLTILVLHTITKRRRARHPPHVSSALVGHGSPSSIANHPLESSIAPMMGPAPLLPPYTKDFQMSDSASWLKQPNAR